MPDSGNTPAAVVIHRQAAEYLLKVTRAAMANLERHRANGTYGPKEAMAAGHAIKNCAKVSAYLESRMRAAEFEAALAEVCDAEGVQLQTTELTPDIQLQTFEIKNV